ncbi:MAG TPA: hypothetical protein VKG63_08770 [Steroidobacteraceae bacterium]|nr:hypothetical protein [Steroidobacteraceae bacterium]
MLPPEFKGGATEHCRVWLNWAAAQVDACLASDKTASDQLLAALGEFFVPEQPRGGAAPAPAGDAISGKLSAVIMAVQAHDRIMQGLEHVAQSLRALHEQLGDAQRAGSAESWRSLREKQFRAFSMAEERVLFARLVAREHEGRREVALNPEETVDLLTSDDGLFEP